METSPLLDLCEPLFQAICRLNRANRKNSPPGYSVTYREIETIFQRMERDSKAKADLEVDYKAVELALLFFVDSTISESSLPFAADWDRRRLAYLRKELAGDQKFFDLLGHAFEEAKRRSSLTTGAGKEERLAVYYTCLGLGFSGFDAIQSETVKEKLEELRPWVKAYVDTDESGLLTPDAYEHTNTVNLPLPISATLVPLLIAIVGLFLLVGGVNFYTFHAMSGDLENALDSIIARSPANAPASLPTGR